MRSTSVIGVRRPLSRRGARTKWLAAIALAAALIAGTASTGFAFILNWTNRATAPGFGPAVSIGGGKLVLFGVDAAETGIVPYIYSPTANTWTAGASTLWVPSDDIFLGAEAATLANNGTVIVMGGVDQFNEQTTKVAAYNPTTNTWKNLAPLLKARDSAAAVTGPAGKIYAIGGEAGGDSGGNGEKTLKSVEAYSLSTNTWKEIKPLIVARFQEAAAVGANGLIYVFGGCNSSGCSKDNTAEMLDPSSASNTWHMLATLMPGGSPRGGAALGGAGGSLIYINGVGSYKPATGVWSAFVASPINPFDFVGVGGSCGYIYGIENAVPAPMDRAATIAHTGC